MIVRAENGPPTLEAAAQQLGVDVSAVDREFGVILTDPKQGLYSVQVDAVQLPGAIAGQEPYRGPFSSPQIDLFGPPDAGVPDDLEKKKSR